MKRETRNETIHQLKELGFILVKGYRQLYINEVGQVYSLEHDRYLTPTAKNYIRLEKGYLSIPKLVLMAFKGEPYRSGQIHYIDGNSKNMSRENVKYSCLFPTNKSVIVNKHDLMTAIRCYFEVDKRYTIDDAYTTRRYLQTITEHRSFMQLNDSKQYIEVYKTYINVFLFGLNSIVETAKVHSLSVRDCSIIVNGFTNELITDILNDLEKGKLKNHPYKQKKPTKAQQTRQSNNYLKSIGQSPMTTRNKSAKGI
jgi:hypothetical protein